jgi:O-antigen ligase
MLFLGVFTACAVGALFSPLLGVIGYMAHYCIGPERQWWGEVVGHWGIRYSFMLGAATAVGILIHYRKLRFGASVLVGQETLALLFLGVVWLTRVIGEDPSWQKEAFPGQDPLHLKMTKVILFALMLTHVVTNMKDLDRIMWLLVITSLMLGLQAYDISHKGYYQGRLETVGGPDFRESNFLAAHLGAMLPVIGAQFLRSDWRGKAACAVAGVFATNAIILTRSRGAVVGLAIGAVAALLLSPKKHRLKILAGLAVAVAGGLYLTDPGFIERARTINAPEEERDASAQARIDVWRGGARMAAANPMGVGPGNFRHAIGRYAPEYPDRDAHNAFVRCAGELGFPGLILYIAVIGNAFRVLGRVARRARNLPDADGVKFLYMAYGIGVGLIIYLGCGLTVSTLYGEGLWWLFLLPVCLDRALDNVLIERGLDSEVTLRQPVPADAP